MQTNQPTSKELACEPPGTLGLGQSCVRPPKTLEGQENRTCFDLSGLPAKPPGKPRRLFRRFMAEKGQKAPKRTAITSLGSPGFHPTPFRGFLAEKGQKTRKWPWTTSLGSPGLSSQSVSGFSGQKAPRNPDADWDDKPGKPRLVIPIHFEVFWKKKAKKHTNGPG